MKLFNGSYSLRSYSNGYAYGYSDDYYYGYFSQTFSIIYDGENWNFKSFIHYEEHCFCTSCRDPDDLLCMTIRESQIVPVPAGSRIQDVLIDVLVNAWPLNFDMLMEVGIDLEDGTSTLLFHTVGKGGTPITPFGSIVRSSDGCVQVVDVPTGECDVFLPTSGTYIKIYSSFL